jgi:hypothetical protein
MNDDAASGKRAGMIAFGDIELGIRREAPYLYYAA